MVLRGIPEEWYAAMPSPVASMFLNKELLFKRDWKTLHDKAIKSRKQRSQEPKGAGSGTGGSRKGGVKKQTAAAAAAAEEAADGGGWGGGGGDDAFLFDNEFQDATGGGEAAAAAAVPTPKPDKKNQMCINHELVHVIDRLNTGCSTEDLRDRYVSDIEIMMKQSGYDSEKMMRMIQGAYNHPNAVRWVCALVHAIIRVKRRKKKSEPAPKVSKKSSSNGSGAGGRKRKITHPDELD